MAGLMEYLSLAFAISGGYIAVKYGPQIINNLQQNQDQSGTKTQQPSDTSTQTTTSPTDATDADRTYQPAQPVLTKPDTSSTTWNPRTERIVAGTITPVDATDARLHQNQTGTYGPSSQNKARKIVQHPVPSGGPQGTAPIVRKHPHTHHHVAASTPSTPNKKCICGTGGTWEGPGCNVGGFPCSTPGQQGVAAYIGYADSYTIPVAGPQWRKSIPYNQLIASQGMVQGNRVRRALAANNHNFMPGGFVLSDAATRRGYNNVYSAGT